MSDRPSGEGAGGGSDGGGAEADNREARRSLPRRRARRPLLPRRFAAWRGRLPTVLHLARALLLAEAVTPEALAEALVLAATQGTSLPRGLIGAHAIDSAQLEQFFETYHEGSSAPVLLRVTPLRELAANLPPGLCERLQAVPVRRDPLTSV